MQILANSASVITPCWTLVMAICHIQTADCRFPSAVRKLADQTADRVDGAALLPTGAMSSACSESLRQPGNAASTSRTPRHSLAGGTDGTSQLLQAKESSADPLTRPQPAASSCLAKYASSSVGAISVWARASDLQVPPPPPVPSGCSLTPGGGFRSGSTDSSYCVPRRMFAMTSCPCTGSYRTRSSAPPSSRSAA